jgi:predicted transcriptional regulator
MLKTVAELRIDTISNRKAANAITAINHKLRQQMLQLIHKNGRMTVTEIYKYFRIEQSVASKFLGMLNKKKYFNVFMINMLKMKHNPVMMPLEVMRRG